MQVLPTLHAVLSKLYGVPTIRITWDICVVAVVKAFGGSVINFFYSGKWERFVFQGLLVGALGAFFIREFIVILKKELGFDLRKTTRTFAENRRSRIVSKTQVAAEGPVDENRSDSVADL
jgi:hypothetical protein